MVTGIGVDIIEVDRVATKLKRENGFKELLFSKNEIAYCEAKANKYEHYAARFAAKEAFFKAIGTGWAANTAFNEVEVFNNAAGKPGLAFSGATLIAMNALKIDNIQLSITHIKEIAAAFVVIENNL